MTSEPAAAEKPDGPYAEDELPWEYPEDACADEAVDVESSDQSTRSQRLRLLQEMLITSAPSGLSELIPRLVQVARVLGVHQPLPTVTEKPLYDVLVALLLRALLRADVTRGAIPPRKDLEVLTDRFVVVSSKSFGLEPNDIEVLDGLLVAPVS
jgi:hypothetical protein